MASFIITNERGYYLEDVDESSVSWTAFKSCAKEFPYMAEAKKIKNRLQRFGRGPINILFRE